MGKLSKDKLEEQIAKSVISELSNEKLNSASKFINLDLQRRKLNKSHKTYVNGVKRAIDHNKASRCYFSYNLDSVLTGRLSCSKYDTEEGPMGVSFHTLPRERKTNIRRMFTAPRGQAFITIDYKGMELRVLAHISREEKMKQAFIEGKDLHTYSASLTFDVPYDKVTPEQRQIAKEPSFLTVYGGTEYTLAKKRGISLKKAKNIIESWLDAFPGVREYKEFIYNFLQKYKYVYSLFGRRRNLPDVDSSNWAVQKHALNQGLNFTVQSPSSDILLMAAIKVHGRLRETNARIVASVHDSIELIAPYDELEEVLKICYDEMTDVSIMRDKFGVEFSVPLEIETLVGKSFGDGIELGYGPGGEISNTEEVARYLEI